MFLRCLFGFAFLLSNAMGAPTVGINPNNPISDAVSPLSVRPIVKNRSLTTVQSQKDDCPSDCSQALSLENQIHAVDMRIHDVVVSMSPGDNVPLPPPAPGSRKSGGSCKPTCVQVLALQKKLKEQQLKLTDFQAKAAAKKKADAEAKHAAELAAAEQKKKEAAAAEEHKKMLAELESLQHQVNNIPPATPNPQRQALMRESVKTANSVSRLVQSQKLAPQVQVPPILNPGTPATINAQQKSKSMNDLLREAEAPIASVKPAPAAQTHPDQQAPTCPKDCSEAHALASQIYSIEQEIHALQVSTFPGKSFSVPQAPTLGAASGSCGAGCPQIVSLKGALFNAENRLARQKTIAAKLKEKSAQQPISLPAVAPIDVGTPQPKAIPVQSGPFAGTHRTGDKPQEAPENPELARRAEKWAKADAMGNNITQAIDAMPWSEMLYWLNLQNTPHPTSAQINDAYRAILPIYHPDRSDNYPGNDKAKSERVFEVITIIRKNLLSGASQPTPSASIIPPAPPTPVLSSSRALVVHDPVKAEQNKAASQALADHPTLADQLTKQRGLLRPSTPPPPAKAPLPAAAPLALPAPKSWEDMKRQPLAIGGPTLDEEMEERTGTRAPQIGYEEDYDLNPGDERALTVQGPSRANQIGQKIGGGVMTLLGVGKGVFQGIQAKRQTNNNYNADFSVDGGPMISGAGPRFNFSPHLNIGGGNFSQGLGYPGGGYPGYAGPAYNMLGTSTMNQFDVAGGGLVENSSWGDYTMGMGGGMYGMGMGGMGGYGGGGMGGWGGGMNPYDYALREEQMELGYGLQEDQMKYAMLGSALGTFGSAFSSSGSGTVPLYDSSQSTASYNRSNNLGSSGYSGGYGATGSNYDRSLFDGSLGSSSSSYPYTGSSSSRSYGSNYGSSSISNNYDFGLGSSSSGNLSSGSNSSSSYSGSNLY